MDRHKLTDRADSLRFPCALPNEAGLPRVNTGRTDWSKPKGQNIRLKKGRGSDD